MAFAFALQIYIGLFGIPGPLARWMTGYEETLPPEPRLVVVLGGGGIPSESGLMRTYHAASFGAEHTGLVYVVSLPSDGDPETNSVGRMRDELVMRGIPAKSIRMETKALNTHEQAVNVAALLGPAAASGEVLIVTSPWHVRRSLLCFRKAGFQHVNSLAAFNTGAEADFGGGTFMRYAFWANLQAGIDCARECCALLVYKLRGWI